MRYAVLLIGLMAWQSWQGTARAELPADLQAEMSHSGEALLIGGWQYKDRRWGTLAPVHDALQQLAQGLAPHFRRVLPPLENPTVDGLRRALREFLIGRASQ